MKKEQTKIPIETALTRLFLPVCFLEGIKVHITGCKHTGMNLHTHTLCIHLWGDTDKQRMFTDKYTVHIIYVNRYLLYAKPPNWLQWAHMT